MFRADVAADASPMTTQRSTSRTRIDEAAVRRIVRTYHRAPVDALEHGETWYANAALEAAEIATDNGLSFRQAAGVIAALSPRVDWSSNVRRAREIARAAAAGESLPRIGLKANARKAWEIAHGADPVDVLGGPKVRAFYANITGDYSVATVDVWAARVAGVPNPDSLGIAKYRRADHAYRAAARRLGIATAVLQATVWITVRGAAF